MVFQTHLNLLHNHHFNFSPPVIILEFPVAVSGKKLAHLGCTRSSPGSLTKTSISLGGAGPTDSNLMSPGSRICFLREPEILFHSGCPFKDEPRVCLC